MVALNMLDSGAARVAEPIGDHQWQVNQWLEKAVLLSFRLNDMACIPSGTTYPGSGEALWWDKVPQNLLVGMRPGSALQAFALFPAVLSGTLPILRLVLC